jgi:N-acetyl-anhydromuramyl-L-alanine amidase AmpD
MKVNKIVIHCADTFADMDIGLKEITQWHLQRGFSDVGYHYIIRRDGSVETGRSELVMGAHAKGHNHDSLGVCLVGGKARNGEMACNFTSAQWITLTKLIRNLKDIHQCDIFGHNELDPSKTCPTFNVKSWAETL